MGKSHRAVLAFDYGLSQIGVAAGNTLIGTAQPITVLKARDGVPDWRAVQCLLQEWRPQLLLVGDPLHMDGTLSELSGRARKFSRRLQGRSGLPVEMVDERLSSVAAKEALRARGHRGNFKHEPADAIAAQLILETWLAENPLRD